MRVLLVVCFALLCASASAQQWPVGSATGLSAACASAANSTQGQAAAVAQAGLYTGICTTLIQFTNNVGMAFLGTNTTVSASCTGSPNSGFGNWGAFTNACFYFNSSSNTSTPFGRLVQLSSTFSTSYTFSLLGTSKTYAISGGALNSSWACIPAVCTAADEQAYATQFQAAAWASIKAYQANYTAGSTSAGGNSFASTSLQFTSQDLNNSANSYTVPASTGAASSVQVSIIAMIVAAFFAAFASKF